MIDEIRAQPHQIGDALWRTDAAQIPSEELGGGLAVCGVGGSAIGGDLAIAAIGERARRQVRTVRGYAPESWLTPDTLVLCASYSGSTEETLSAFDAAGEAGARRVVLTTGGPLAERARDAGVPVIGVPAGMQPRAAVVYMVVAALECAAACGAAPSLRAELEAARGVIEDVLAGDEAERIAEQLQGTVPVVHGAGPTFPVAYRWKAQLNENAKRPAFASALSEANHNEIEGWQQGLAAAPFAAVLLQARGWHERIDRRFDVLGEQLAALGAPVVRAHARGDDPVAKVLSLVTLGDLVSVALAGLEGVDPAPIPAIEAFKQAL